VDGVENVTDEQRQREEIERGEQWFAGVCGPSAGIDTARIKQAMRIAVEELWLAGQVPQDVPEGLTVHARRAVREALRESPCDAGDQGRTRRFRVWRWVGERQILRFAQDDTRRMRVVRAWAWIGGGLAAAAAIGLAVIGPRHASPTVHPDDAALNLAVVFEEFQDDEELDQELSELREAFSELDRIVAQDWGEDLWEEPADEAPDPTEDGA